MEQLIFVAVIIFFSILDGIARKRRGSGQQPAPGRPHDGGVAPPSGSGAGRGADETWGVASYDDPVEEEAADEEDERLPAARTILPPELWEEISALARGDVPPQPRPFPVEPPRPRDEGPPARRETRAAVAASRPSQRRGRGTRRAGTAGGAKPESRRGAEHAVHRSHPEWGMDPSSRAPVPAPAAAADPGAPLRRALRAGGRDELRRAVILADILGPPTAYREPAGDP